MVVETSLPSLEDCNTCTCEDVGPCPQDAEMRCAAADCSPGCSYAGRSYPEGVWFPATDGCNECTCSGGEPRWASADCACDPEREYWREYTVATADECTSLNIDCPMGSVRFVNDCGCGCEQSPECPARADCGQGRPDVSAGAGASMPAYVRCEAVSVCPVTRGVEVM